MLSSGYCFLPMSIHYSIKCPINYYFHYMVLHWRLCWRVRWRGMSLRRRTRLGLCLRVACCLLSVITCLGFSSSITTRRILGECLLCLHIMLGSILSCMEVFITLIYNISSCNSINTGKATISSFDFFISTLFNIKMKKLRKT